jgi:hypothetical protein
VTPEIDSKLQDTIDRFTDAVLSGDARAMCKLLVGHASVMQGCGTDEEDINPQISQALRQPGAEITVQQSSAATAVGSFPDFRSNPASVNRQNRGRQGLSLILDSDGMWKISDFGFLGP